jgi:hypothetical protein
VPGLKGPSGSLGPPRRLDTIPRHKSRKARVAAVRSRWSHGRRRIAPVIVIALATPKTAAKNRSPRANARPKPRPATICARCGKGFVGRSDARTCSNACRQALYRNRIPLQLKRNEAALLMLDTIPTPEQPPSQPQYAGGWSPDIKPAPASPPAPREPTLERDEVRRVNGADAMAGLRN